MKLKNRITHFSPNLYFSNLIVNMIYQNALSFPSNLDISNIYTDICAKWKSCFLCPNSKWWPIGIETIFAIFNNKNSKSYSTASSVIWTFTLPDLHSFAKWFIFKQIQHCWQPLFALHAALAGPKFCILKFYFIWRICCLILVWRPFLKVFTCRQSAVGPHSSVPHHSMVT